jgi:aspartyl-tRNA(Asn)/glutamyl-tRNA(Gln) amidotransferase subunit A
MHTLSALELHHRFCRGELTAVEITTTFLKRIAQYDKEIGAFLIVFSDRAMQKARALDAKKAAGQPIGKLAAIPIAIKDNINIKGEFTTCGSKFLTNYRAPFDATVTELLEAEDAILIGKTNLDEFAMGSSTENSALQRTGNPWNLKCSPGGSSGGSAAAVAARLCPIALGSDTGGSVRQPGALCGVVGYKPTYGRVSRSGLVAFGSSLDQIGTLATSAADVALIMEVLGRQCDKDSTSIPEPAEEYLRFFDGNISGKKIGVPFHLLEALNLEAKQLFLQSVEQLKGLGAQIIDVNLDLLKYAVAVYYILATAEASTNLARFDGIRYGRRSARAETLEEVYEFSKEEGFGQEVKRRILLGTYVLSSGYRDAYYRKAQKVRTLMIRQYQEAFTKCSLIVTPVSPFPAFEIGSIKDPLQMYLADIYTIPLNLTGLPGVSIPAGFTAEGKPVGLQIIGPQKQDRDVLHAADAFQKATQYHRALPPLLTNPDRK